MPRGERSPCILKETSAEKHSACIITARLQAAAWPVYSPKVSPTENIWHIKKQKSKKKKNHKNGLSNC